jgi:hypothetical protein
MGTNEETCHRQRLLPTPFFPPEQMIKPKTHPIEGVFLLSLYNINTLTKRDFSISILLCSLNNHFRRHEPSEYQ